MKASMYKIDCMGCGLSCKIDCENKTERPHCTERKFSVWPTGNYYFKRAVNDLVFKTLPCFLPNGVIIVDFSMDNILHFLNGQWIEKLESTGLKIILAVEKSMLSMANFWMQRSSVLWSVVVVNGGVGSFVEKIKRVLSGRTLKSRRLPSLTEHEMTTLRLLADGHSNQDIARVMACDARNVYRFQYSLCKKLGGMDRLRELRFKHPTIAPG